MTSADVGRMRVAGRLVAEAQAQVREILAPGITTGDIDRRVAEFIAGRGGRAAFKGYRGYPASACTSVNEVVVHGIPGERELVEGDIVGFDVGVEYQGIFADGAVTLPVGRISGEAEHLLKVTEEALYLGIAHARAGSRLSDISYAIQQRVEHDGYSVVRDLVGHGIGRRMHQDPQVPNFGPPGKGPVLRAWQALAIEPMVNRGGHEVVTLDDGWTIVTRDGSLSAHFEHTVLITDRGGEILTTTEGDGGQHATAA